MLSRRALAKGRIRKLLEVLEAQDRLLTSGELAEILGVARRTVASLISNVVASDRGLLLKTSSKEGRIPKPGQSKFHWVNRYAIVRGYKRTIKDPVIVGSVQETIEKAKGRNIWEALTRY